MFGIFNRNPIKALEKTYALKLQQARDLQRKGDIVGYSQMEAEADFVLKQIEQIENRRAGESK